MSIGPTGPRPASPPSPSPTKPSTKLSTSDRPVTTASGTENKSFVQVLSEVRREHTTKVGPSAFGPPVIGGSSVPRPIGGQLTTQPGHDQLRAMAESALRAEKKVDALIAAAGRGRSFSAAELIALQATVFRYSQTVEVISRAADRLVGAVKQTLGTQV